MKIVILATLALALGACSSEPPEASNETQAEVAPSGDVGIVAAVDPGNDAAPSATPAPTPTPTPTPTPSAASTTVAAATRTFPVAFRGRWGMNVADCDPKRDDDKGLITVSADAIRFYESRGTITKLTVSSPTRIVADLAFSGEGQRWQSRTVSICVTAAAGWRAPRKSHRDPMCMRNAHDGVGALPATARYVVVRLPKECRCAV